MKAHLNVFLCTLFIASTANLLAPSAAMAEWTGGVEASSVIKGDAKGTRLRFKTVNNERPLYQELYADWIRPDTGGSDYEAGYKPKFWFSERTYAFGEGSLSTSKAAQIDQQQKLFAGLGIQLLNTNMTSLFMEVGAGQTTTKFDNTFLGTENKTIISSNIARMGAQQVLSDFIKLEIDGDYATSDESEQTTAEAGLSLRIPGGSVKYSYRIIKLEIGNNEPVETTDSSVSFSYEF